VSKRRNFDLHRFSNFVSWMPMKGSRSMGSACEPALRSEKAPDECVRLESNSKRHRKPRHHDVARQWPARDDVRYVESNWNR
jgi:hypothetical protein